MPAKRSAGKKPAGTSAKKASKKSARQPLQARKRAAAARPAKTAGRKATKKVAPRASTKLVQKAERAPSRSIATRGQARTPAKPAAAAAPRVEAETRIDSGVGPATVPGTDPKAAHAREHMKKMRGVDSQRVEEHHRMTRHKKNQ